MLEKTYQTHELVWRLLVMMKKLLPWISLAISCAVLGFLVTITIPTTLSALALQAFAGKPITLTYLYALIALAFLRGIFRYGEHYFGHFVAFHSLAVFRQLIFSKLRALSPARLDSQDSGHLLKMIGEDIEALEIFFAHTIAPVGTALFSASLILTYFGSSSWPLAALAALTYVLLAVIIPIAFAKKLEPLLKEQNHTRQSYVSHFLETLRAVRDLLQFQQMDQELQFLSSKSKAVNALDRQVAKAQWLQMTTTFLILALSILSFALLALAQIKEGRLDYDKGLLAFVAFTASFSPFLELGRLPLGFKRAMNAAANIFALLDEVVVEDQGEADLSSVETIALEAVSFSYPKSHQEVYQNLSIAFKNKGIIGIKGPSGSGKSTLVKLLMKWYNWSSGDIFLSGQNSRELKATKLQSRFAYLPQTPQIFQQTLRDNLTFGRTDISDQKLLDLADSCGMKERLLACEKGLDTLISQVDIFSAGEKQRLELMRALLKEADVYILDEPTSNLDSLNEALLINLIKEHCKGFVFLISHRTSTLACADQVFELENGILKEVTPYETLNN
ncbi:amino acid ABC transporter ATP-binding/permease protein [Streptococcus ictaluri]|uniref:ABC transporter, ATP-binding protein n=1 Tax=Streptococcus ictaluri 707-05 TaxID=764299 RepID=G5JZY9_9STRE|nr:ABC transporter ATP-binding protein [Streptococcus ictaluri]EHI70932.1 ABC transporter, ATP-binding protein [Streptococcus ictaluri 707-05]